MGMGLSHDACLDIIHDIFCNLMEKNKVFETDNIRHYLFRSFINRHIDIQKSKKNMIHVDVSDLPFEIDVSVENTTGEEYMIEEEEREKLKQKVEFLLELLTPRQRKAVYLRYMEEMEFDEIGKILDMNAESVRKLVFRGLEKLRKHAGKIPMCYLLAVLFRATSI
jgi:RNA polymerase sigma factor (sigma-70 family)